MVQGVKAKLEGLRAQRQRAGELLERQYLVLGELIGMRTCARRDRAGPVTRPDDTKGRGDGKLSCSDAACRAWSCSGWSR